LIKDLIPELTQRYKAAKKEGQVGLFKGIRGVKSVFKDIAESLVKKKITNGDLYYFFKD